MDFLRALINEEEILTDEQINHFLDEISQLEDLDQIDEDAWARIEKRVTGRELALYALLIDRNKLMLAKNFVELSRKGKSIPSSMVEAYQPIIEMIDDIITAGPSYVQLLRVLHKRAKRD
jgi:hypothetical protein